MGARQGPSEGEGRGVSGRSRGWGQGRCSGGSDGVGGEAWGAAPFNGNPLPSRVSWQLAPGCMGLEMCPWELPLGSCPPGAGLERVTLERRDVQLLAARGGSGRA